MKYIWTKFPAAHVLFACLLSIALLPGCIQETYELPGLDRISFGATTVAPDGDAATKGGDGLSLQADGWFVALGADEGSDVAWQPAPQTKTSYSGEDQSGNSLSGTPGTYGTNSTSSYERIDWVAGDSVTVLSPQAYVRDRSTMPPGLTKTHDTYCKMNYGVVNLGTPSGQYHSAQLSPSDGEGLLWDDSNNNAHYFFAVYPASLDKLNRYQSSNIATFSAEIPASQPPKGQRTLTENGREVLEFLPDMDMVYMYAATNGRRSTGPVALNFKPMVSAARFTIRAADVGGGTLKLTKATLATTSNALYGKMDLRINYDGGLQNISYTETGQSVSIPFDNVQLGDRDIRLTFIALRYQRNNLKLTLEFEGGITRSLELKRGTSSINWPQESKLYFDLAGISYMPTYDLPDAIWGWTQDVLPAPVPENVIDGDGNPVASPGVSYYFKDDGSSTDIATVSGDQINCGTAAGKRILVARVTVGPVTAETEIPVYVQKLDRVEIDEPAEGHNVRVGANYALPYTVYWQRPEDDGTLVEMSTDDATTIYNATTADLAGFYPEASVPTASQTYVAPGTRPGTVKGVAPIAAPGVTVTLSITDGSHATKPTHIVTDETKVFVTDPPFQSAQIVYHIPSFAETQYNSLANETRIFGGDGEVGRIFTVMVSYEDGTYDLYDYTDVTWQPADPALIDITAEGYVTVPQYTHSGNQQNTTITADVTDRYGMSRQVTQAFRIVKPTLLMYVYSGPHGTNPVSASYSVGGTVYEGMYNQLPYDRPWDIYPGISVPRDDDYVSYSGAATWQNPPYGYLIGAAFYYVLKVSTLPAGYTFRSATPYVDGERNRIPYAEEGYQNHKNLHSPVGDMYVNHLSF